MESFSVKSITENLSSLEKYYENETTPWFPEKKVETPTLPKQTLIKTSLRYKKTGSSRQSEKSCSLLVFWKRNCPWIQTPAFWCPPIVCPVLMNTEILGRGSRIPAQGFQTQKTRNHTPEAYSTSKTLRTSQRIQDSWSECQETNKGACQRQGHRHAQRVPCLLRQQRQWQSSAMPVWLQ